MASAQTHIIKLALDSLPFSQAVAVAEKTVTSLGSVTKSVFKGIGAAMAGAAAGMVALNASLDTLEKGLVNAIQYRAGGSFIFLAGEINKATNGVIDMGTAMEMARRAVQGGITEKDAVMVARYAANISAMNGSLTSTPDLARKLYKALESGNIEEDLGVQLGFSKVQALKEASATQDRILKTQTMRKFIEKDLLSVEKQNGDILNTRLSKFLGMIRTIKDESSGAYGLFKGFLQASIGLAAPLGAGIASFAMGPITGIVGTALGAIGSATITAIAVKVLKSFVGGIDGAKQSAQDISKNIVNGITAIFENIGLFAEAALMGITGETGRIGSMSKEQVKRLAELGMKPEDLNKLLTTVRKIGDFFNIFSEEFLNKIDITGITEKFKATFGGDYKGIADSLGSFFGTVVNGIVQSILSIDKNDIDNALLVGEYTVKFFAGIITAIGEMIKGISEGADAGKWLAGDMITKISNIFTTIAEIVTKIVDKASAIFAVFDPNEETSFLGVPTGGNAKASLESTESGTSVAGIEKIDYQRRLAQVESSRARARAESAEKALADAASNSTALILKMDKLATSVGILVAKLDPQ